MDEVYVEAEILARTSKRINSQIICSEIENTQSNYRIFRPKTASQHLEANRRLHNQSQCTVSELLNQVPNMSYNPRLFQPKQQIVTGTHANGIFLGTDIYSKSAIRLLTEYLSSDILSIGSSGSGKTLYNHLFIYNLFSYTGQICLVYLDFKGEAKNSLSYMADGKTETILKNRIHEITYYKSGMLESLFAKDRIIIINLSSVKDDEAKFRTTILSILQDINAKLNQFKREFTKENDHGGMIKIAEFPYKLLIAYEEAYKIFPNIGSHTYNHIKLLNDQYEKKKKLLQISANSFKKQEDYDSYDQVIQQIQEIPDLLYLQSRIMMLAQENANTSRYLGLGSLYSVQRFSELDTGLVSQSSTWMVHNVNSQQDERALKTSKINQMALRDYLRKIPDDKRIEYMLLSTPTAKTIIKKPKPVLFHMAVSQVLEKRNDLIGVDELT